MYIVPLLAHLPIHLKSKRLVPDIDVVDLLRAFASALQNEIYAAFSTNRDHHVKFNCYNQRNETIQTTNMKRFRAGFVREKKN